MSNNYNNQNEEENFSFDKDKKNPFSMPDDYFNSFANKMKIKLELEEELKEFSVLASIPKQNTFALPQNYFAKAEIKLEHSLELQSYAVLNTIKKPELKTEAQEYFELNTQKTVNAIEIVEELKPYATLYSLDKQKAFAIPADYFDAVADRVKEKYYSLSVEKTSVFQQVLAFIFKPKVALAYSLVLIIGVASFFYFNQTSTVIGDCQTLACLEKKELLNEKNSTQFTEDDLYEMIDVDALDKQLNGETTPDNNEDSLLENVIEY